MKKAALHNLGCKVNSYETQAILELLVEDGYEIVDFEEFADVYVINTCSVTSIADRKSRQMIRRAKRLNENACVVATGCYIQGLKGEIPDDLGVDIALGNNKKAEIIPALNEFFEKNTRKNDIDDINRETCFERMHITRDAEHTRAFVKVQDGCNMFCAYCIIPYDRGRPRSRSVKDVIDELHDLAKAGYKEVVITGIHLSSYGIDTGSTLIELLEKCNEVEGIKRIRLGSLEPRIIEPEFLKRAVKLEKLCPHFHLSLQSGCDKTLLAMNRRYTADEYEESCRLLRDAFPDCAITTDVIVGFPGETEEDFDASYEFCKKIGFYELHVFMYSKRTGTKAAVMKNQVPEEIKHERSQKLIALGEKMSREYEDSLMAKGKTFEVLLEEPGVDGNGKSGCFGFSREYIKFFYETKNPNDVQNTIVEI